MKARSPGRGHRSQKLGVPMIAPHCDWCAQRLETLWVVVGVLEVSNKIWCIKRLLFLNIETFKKYGTFLA